MLVMLPEKLYGFRSCSLIYLIRLEPVIIHYDDQSCIKISKNHVFNDRSKHMEMRYHYVHDIVQRRAFSLQYILTNEKTMDVLTKPLLKMKFKYFGDKLGLVENAPLIEREC